MSRRRSLAAAALLLCALFAADPAGADELRVVPSLSAKGEYNSNLFFSSGQRVDTYVGTVTPGFEVTSRTERMDGGFTAQVPVRWYTADTNLDKVSQLYQGRLGYRFSPAFRISGTGGYRDQSNPDRYIEETGLAVVNRSFRYNGSAAAEDTASEKTAASVSYTYEKYDFQNATTSNSETNGGTVLVVHDLGQRFPGTKGRLVLGVSRSTFDTSKVTNYSAAVGVERALHELWSVVADVGVRYTRSEFDVIADTEDDFGWTANVSAVYKGEKSGGSLTLYHDVAAAPGLGSAVQRSAAVLDVRQRTTWELVPFVSAGYYLNRADAGQFGARSINERTVRVRPGMRYDATRNFFLEAAYQYTWLRDSAADTTASQSVVYLMATLRYPLYE